MSGATKKIARELVHLGTNTFGFLAKQLGLGYLATRAQNRVNQILSLIGLEAANVLVSPLTEKVWNETAPIWEEFASPIVHKIIEQPLEYLQGKGFLTLNEVVPPSPSWWNFSDVFSDFLVKQPGFIWGYWKNWWSPQPHSAVQAALDAAKEKAPIAGEFVATGMEYAWKGITSPMKIFECIDAISVTTGLSYTTVLLVTLGMSGLAIYGLASLLRPSAVATATATATATGGNAVAHGGAINVFFAPAVQNPPPAPGPVAPAPLPGPVLPALAPPPPAPVPPVVAPAPAPAPAPGPVAPARWCNIL